MNNLLLTLEFDMIAPFGIHEILHWCLSDSFTGDWYETGVSMIETAEQELLN